MVRLAYVWRLQMETTFDGFQLLVPLTPDLDVEAFGVALSPEVGTWSHLSVWIGQA